MDCKICSGETNQLLDVQFEHMYFYCKTCHFVFIEDKHYVSFETEKEIYELHENSLDDKGYVTYLENYINEGVSPFIKEGLGLDFGSGPEPALATLLKKRGYEMDIYDRHYANNIDIWEKKYDFITSTEVIEHFHDPMDTLNRMVSILKPGGILSVMTLFLMDDLSLFQNWWYRRDPTHIAFYSPITFEKIAEQLNLEIIYHNNKRICVFKKQ